jgi:indole-3-glycerol phosphate synthase
MTLLARILETKQKEIAQGRHRPLPAPPALRPIHLCRAESDPLRIVAEIKLRSPSAGQLSTRLSISERAAIYERSGCSMISVLCDQEFFGGSFENLTLTRQACTLPILCKDYVIDERQLDWARAFGADAVLLIARCLDRASLQRLHQAALARGLLALVEIANLQEAQTVLELGLPVIGVNARDLDTLQMDQARARTVLCALPPTTTRIHFSGLKAAEDVATVNKSGLDAALIGEVLMRLDDPEPLLTAMVKAAATPRQG